MYFHRLPKSNRYFFFVIIPIRNPCAGIKTCRQSKDIVRICQFKIIQIRSIPAADRKVGPIADRIGTPTPENLIAVENAFGIVQKPL